MIKSKISLFSSALLVLGFLSVAGSTQAATFCSGNVVVDITQHIANDPDSGSFGGYWAIDNFDRHIQIFDTPTPGEYCAETQDVGTFTTGMDAKSPESGAVLPQVITGTMIGGTHGTLVGTLGDAGGWGVSGAAPAQDCNSLACSMTSLWVENYFAPGAYTYDWGWTYTSTLGEAWINASSGNSGDIHAFVNTSSLVGYATLQDAINAASSGDTIVLGGNLTTSAQVNILSPLTINGNGFTLNAAFIKTDNSNNSGVGIINTNGVTLKNLVLDGTGSTNLHGLNVYQATNITLDNVTLSNNGRAGAVVNGSVVTANNITTLNNGWGGINVDLGSGVTSPAILTVNGTSHHIETNAHIWVDDITKDVSVVDTNNQYGFKNTGNLRVYKLLPKITLNGSASMTVFASNGYTEEGATAVDYLGGSLAVIITGSVNDDEPGTYVLTYSATDVFGNTVSVNRTVGVIASSGGGGGGGSSSGGEVLGASTSNVEPGEVLGMTDGEKQAKITNITNQLVSKINELIALLQAQLAAAVLAGN